MTQAARALNLAQSAASHAIATLESRHNTALFDRIGRGIVLTEAGHAFLAEARAILAQVDRAERTLSEFGSLERGTLSVHASQTIASYWLPRYLVAFHRLHPRIDIRLEVGNSAQVADAIETGAADLGLVEGVIEREQLLSSRVASDQMVLVAGQDHDWGHKTRLMMNDLGETEWVLRESGSGTRSAFEQALRQVGFAPEQLRVAMELPSNEAVRAAVEAGLGATALSASVAASSIENGLLIHVPFKLPQREFHVLRHSQLPLSHVAHAFSKILGRSPCSSSSKPHK